MEPFYWRVKMSKWLQLKITGVYLEEQEYCDIIVINTNTPNGKWPFDGTQQFTTTVEKGGGKEWIEQHLTKSE